jgi:hypothetical protein
MSSPTVNDIVVFAERVERLCDFLLDGLEKDGSHDVLVIQKLKEDSADLQSIKKNVNVSIEGLDNHMRGILKPE